MEMHVFTKETPLGLIKIGIIQGKINILVFSEYWEKALAQFERRLPAQADSLRYTTSNDLPLIHSIGDALEHYFAGTGWAFPQLVPYLVGTRIQLQVWNALQQIPYGSTVTYGQLAQQLGSAKAARAVGTACGANLIWIVVPCHRVVGANQKLTGYAGGIERKAWLLKHEQHFAALSDSNDHKYKRPVQQLEMSI